MYDWLVLPLFMLVGFAFLWLFVKIVTARSERQSSAAEWRELVANAQAARTARLNTLLWEIKTAPEWQKAEMWQEYLAMEAEGKDLTRKDRALVVSLETVIDDQTQAELDAGINPYKAEKQPRVVVNTKRARLGWK